jgi:hypothetical protein
VYVGGDFLQVGATSVNQIARWNIATSWTALGSGTDDVVFALSVTGTDVFVGGYFVGAGGVTVNQIAKWNGSSWSPLSSGTNGTVYAVAVSGTDVYVGGQFTLAGGVPVNNLAKWNGSSWSALGSGSNNGVTGASPSVLALAVKGTDVFVGGTFTSAGGTTVPANHVARWDTISSTWSSLGTGANNGTNNDVEALAVSGSDVYAGGQFTTAGGPSANYIARWNMTDSSWSPLGAGTNGTVFAIAVSGTNLYAGGSFNHAGGGNALNIAKWNGSSWSPLGSGTDLSVYSIATSGLNVYVGGDFINAGSDGSYHFGIWHEPPPTPTPTATRTATATATTIPMLVVGHVAWQGLPAQPNPVQEMPITMTLKSGATEVNYARRLTDLSGFFTVTVSLPPGSYQWRVKGNTYLASSGVFTLTGVSTQQVEMGTQKVGDLTGDNVNSVADFNQYKTNFGIGGVPPLGPGSGDK